VAACRTRTFTVEVTWQYSQMRTFTVEVTWQYSQMRTFTVEVTWQSVGRARSPHVSVALDSDNLP